MLPRGPCWACGACCYHRPGSRAGHAARPARAASLGVRRVLPAWAGVPVLGVLRVLCRIQTRRPTALQRHHRPDSTADSFFNFTFTFLYDCCWCRCCCRAPPPWRPGGPRAAPGAGGGAGGAGGAVIGAGQPAERGAGGAGRAGWRGARPSADAPREAMGAPAKRGVGPVCARSGLRCSWGCGLSWACVGLSAVPPG